MRNTIFEDLHIEDDIEYSLNKKERWKLFEMLQNSITSGDFATDKFNIRLIVSHFSLARQGRQMTFYSSTGKTRELHTGTSTYYNAESLIAVENQEVTKMGFEDHPIIQCEFLFRCPSSSSFSFHPNCGGFPFDFNSYKRFQKSSFKRYSMAHISDKQWRKQNALKKEYCKDNDFLIDKFDESDTEEEFDSELSHYIHNKCHDTTSYTISLKEVMTKSTKNRCKSRAKKGTVVTQLDSKNMKMFIPFPDMYNDTVERSPHCRPDLNINNRQPIDRLNYVYVILQNKDVEHNKLKTKYGNKYISCPRFPQTFIIDISDRIKDQMQTSTYWNTAYLGNLEIISCVVFTHDDTDGKNTFNLMVFKVTLNISTKSNNSRIVTIRDYYESCGVEEVLQKAILYVVQLPQIDFLKTENHPPKKLFYTDFKNLNNALKIKKHAFFITRKGCFQEMFDNGETVIGSNDTHRGNNLSMKDAKMCGICFDQFQAKKKSKVALGLCGHSFCEDCWLFYVKIRITTSSHQIVCPEKNCPDVLQTPVLLTVLNIYDVLNFKKRMLERELKSSSSWCPNTDCGYVINVSDPTKARDIACDCGSQFCVQCLNQAHWPLTCEMASVYWSKLQRLGDDNLGVDLSLNFMKIQGKKCPKCKTFFQFASGSLVKTCFICGAQFCWSCLTLKSEHSERRLWRMYMCSCFVSSYHLIGKETLTVDHIKGYNNTSNRNKCGYYRRAVNCRNSRHSSEISKLKLCIRKIKRLKFFNTAKQKGPIYLPMLYESGVKEMSKLTSEEKQDEIEHLLDDMLQLYIELQHIAEHCFILLDRLSRSGKRYIRFRSALLNLCNCAVAIQELLCNNSMHNIRKNFRKLIVSVLTLKEKGNRAIQTVVQICKESDL